MEKEYELGDTVYGVKRFSFLDKDFPIIKECKIIGKRMCDDKIEYECIIKEYFVTTGTFFIEALHDSKEDAIIAIEDEYKKWGIETQKKIDEKKVELG